MTSEDIFGDILAETETSPKAQVAKPVGAQPVSDVAAEENTATEETVTMAEAVEDNKETEAVKEAYVQQEEEKTEPVSEADVIEIAVEGEIAETTALPEEEQPVPTYFEEPEASAEAETVYSADEQAYVQPSDQDQDEVPGQAFLSMPMIAGGIGLVLCFVVLAGWYFMSSDAEPVAQQPASAIMEPAATPQPEAPVVSETPVVESASQEDLSMPGSTEDPVIEQPAARPEQVSVREDRTPTPRRQALQNTPPRERPVPATQTKPTPQPRKVTVDDLINDN